MNPYEHEQEEIQALKDWWNKNGNSFMVGIAIAVAGVGGWKFWQNHTEQQAVNASEAYQLVVESADKLESMQVNTESLVKDFPKSEYAALASLSLAKALVAEEKYDEAAAQLSWVQANAGSQELKAIAVLRLAQIQYAQEKYDEANRALAASLPDSFSSRQQELIGDIAIAKGDKETAIQAFEKAVNSLEEGDSQRRRILELKLADARGRA